MYFQIHCNHCGKTLKVREELSGRKCGCPHCHKTVQIPTLSTLGKESAQPASQAPGIQIDTRSAAKSAAKSAVRSVESPKKIRVDASYVDSTNVSMVWSGLIGLSATVLFYVVILLIRHLPWTEIFWDRGWVPYAIVLMTFWSLAILLLKAQKLAKQKQAMLLDVLPTELSDEITFDSIDKFLAHISRLPSVGDSFLVNRVVRGIEHFRVRKSTAETVTMMELQSAIDANNVAGSYTLLKVFIWALPILGFIGTVIGISAAVAGLSGSLENASDISAIKGALNEVFAGLGTAFDTTLLALVLSLLIKVPASAMQKSEEDLITWVDEYCNENLLKRLDDHRQGGAQRGVVGSSGVDVEVIRDVFASAMSVYHEDWNRQVVEMNEATQQLQQAFAAIGQQTEQMQLNVMDSVKVSDQSLEQHFTGLQQGLEKLNSVLTDLGKHQIVVQQVDPPKKGWFRRG
ncbi:MAG: MotA/TolQ/ExbB proton channel family protein [Mariniblastus sp.]|nr:MotA/TolQ/ExbB proton channel family protein [Mariniblastus sp.]